MFARKNKNNLICWLIIMMMTALHIFSDAKLRAPRATSWGVEMRLVAFFLLAN